MYSLLKPLLFRQDAETSHERVILGLAWAGKHPGVLRLISPVCQQRDPRLEVKRFGLTFSNPIGLAAGLDKDALAVPSWPALGFGFSEIGSVTALAQPGNPKPRLFRLPQDQALINHMGFNNAGAEAVAQRLARLKQDYPSWPIPLGVNVGKSHRAPLDDASQDYLRSLEFLWPYADYFVLNVSSPNTPGLRQLQDKARLTALLQAVQDFTASQVIARPILLKIAPDVSFSQLDEIVELALHFELAGLAATNTTTSREGLHAPVNEAGGLSGRPLGARSLEVLRYLHGQLKGRLPLISVGGIFSADDVVERLLAGASLVQLYTSFIYQGPLLLKKLNKGILERLELEGITSVQELIGQNTKA